MAAVAHRPGPERKDNMPAYVSLFNFTEQGLHGAKEIPKRVKASRDMWEKAGGRIIGIWYTQGQYDGVFIHEAPDDETATRLLFSLGLVGNVRTTTLRAFGEEEIARIVGKLP
jgi:uncharacterized protein with GYD domain